MLVTCLFDLKGEYLDWMFGISLDRQTLRWVRCNNAEPLVVDQVPGGPIYFMGYFNVCSTTALDPKLFTMGATTVPKDIAFPFVTLTDKNPLVPFSNHTCVMKPPVSPYYQVTWKNQQIPCLNNPVPVIQYQNIQGEPAPTTFVVRDGVVRTSDQDTSTPLLTWIQFSNKGNVFLDLLDPPFFFTPTMPIYVKKLTQATYLLNDGGSLATTPCDGCQITRIENLPISENSWQVIVDHLANGIETDSKTKLTGTLSLMDENNKVLVYHRFEATSSATPNIENVTQTIKVGVQMDVKGQFIMSKGFMRESGDVTFIDCPTSILYFDLYPGEKVQFVAWAHDCSHLDQTAFALLAKTSVPASLLSNTSIPVLVLKDKDPLHPYSNMTCVIEDDISTYPQNFFGTEWITKDTPAPCSGPIPGPVMLGANPTYVKHPFTFEVNVDTTVVLPNKPLVGTKSSWEQLLSQEKEPLEIQGQLHTTNLPSYIYSVEDAYASLYLGVLHYTLPPCQECNHQRVDRIPMDGNVLDHVAGQMATSVASDDFVINGMLTLHDALHKESWVYKITQK